jgi:uncharacterized protein (TIGR03067 family)
MSRFSLLIVLVTASPFFAAPVPKVKEKKPTLQGVWEVVERQNDGKPLTGRPREFWTINGTDIAMRFGKDESALKDPDPIILWLDQPDADDPTAVSVIQKFPCGQTTTCKTRVEFDGETVRLGMGSSDNGPRPAAARPVVGVCYLVLKRVDEAKLKDEKK